jgi:hypothetical protein
LDEDAITVIEVDDPFDSDLSDLSESEDEIDEEHLSRSQKLNLRASKEQKRKQREVKKRRWRERESRNEARTKAIARLNNATQNNCDLPELQKSIQVARAARLEGEVPTKRGQEPAVWRTPLLHKAVKMLPEMVMKHERIEAEKIFQDTLKKSFVRSDPIGVDRSYSRYWLFERDKSRLYVEIIKPKHSVETVLHFGTNDTKGDHFTATRPEMHVSEWAFFKSKEQVMALLKSLDDRGVRERALKRAFEERLPALLEELVEDTPDSDAWRTDGDFVGKRVRRIFPHGHADGVVTRWIPADEKEGDPPFWHVVHEDGDQEDLERHELDEAMANFEQQVAGKPHEHDEFLQYENVLAKPRIRAGDMGVDAVREHLTQIEASVFEGLKERGSTWNSKMKSEGSPKSSTRRSVWLSDVKSAKSGADFAALAITLEDAVHALQKGEDIRVDENSDKWKVEGHELIGTAVQRIIDEDGEKVSCKGTIAKYRPADEMSENTSTLFRVVYDNGDVQTEDYDEAVLMPLVEAKGESSDLDLTDAKPIYIRNRGVGGQDTLWCTWEFRNNWISALQLAKALHTVVMAVDCFFDHCVAFGVGEPLTAEKKVRSSRSKKNATEDVSATLKWQCWDSSY